MTPNSPAQDMPDLTDYEAWWGDEPVAAHGEFLCESIGPGGHSQLTIRDGQLRLDVTHPDVASEVCSTSHIRWWGLKRTRTIMTVVIGLEDRSFQAQFPNQLRTCIETGLGTTLGYHLQAAAG